MTKAREQLLVFVTGGIGYLLLELLWRRRTHWCMGITGGFCFSVLYNVYNKFRSITLREKCFFGSILITLAELLVGMAVNLKKKWQVWDYSKLPFNFLGQICLPYSVLWFLLSAGLVPLSKGMKWLVRPSVR